jgi:hypothetical protein
VDKNKRIYFYSHNGKHHSIDANNIRRDYASEREYWDAIAEHHATHANVVLANLNDLPDPDRDTAISRTDLDTFTNAHRTSDPAAD